MHQKWKNNCRQRRSSSPSTSRSSRSSSSTESPPPQNPQVPIVPNAPQAPEAPLLPALHIPPLNWSHFKCKYLGKPDEDAEAHSPRTNDWMDTHGFQDLVKVQRFCLTLTWETRLW